MHTMIEAPTASVLYWKVLQNLLTNPDTEAVGPRNMPTLELRNCTYVLKDPRFCAAWLPERGINYPFMFAEFLWIFCGRSDVEMISFYNQAISKFSDDGRVFWGAYGPRWRSQIAGVVGRLVADMETRQAIVGVWRPEYNIGSTAFEDLSVYMYTKDVPCTLSMQYFIRNARLEATVVMRSSDVWLGLPYDIFNFSMLQRAVADELNINPGPLTMFIGSSHLYHQNMADARLVGGPSNIVVEVPKPPGLAHEYVNRQEEMLRKGGNLAGILSGCTPEWLPFLSMLAYRQHKDQRGVDSSVRMLLTGGKLI